MNADSYASLASALKAIGLSGYQKRPDQMVVSSQEGPAWPNRGNSFWLSLQGGTWYLSTWLPACYRVPAGQDIVALCSACMELQASAMYRMPDEIATRFGLEHISDSEFERLFPDDEH
jgi:hypothetical protein